MFWIGCAQRLVLKQRAKGVTVAQMHEVLNISVALRSAERSLRRFSWTKGVVAGEEGGG